jgi:hypothetical protein
VQLYRAISTEELQSIAAVGGLSCVDGSLEGKWLAESIEAAVRWGELIYGVGRFSVIAVEVKDDDANRFFRLTK